MSVRFLRHIHQFPTCAVCGTCKPRTRPKITPPLAPSLLSHTPLVPKVSKETPMSSTKKVTLKEDAHQRKRLLEMTLQALSRQHNPLSDSTPDMSASDATAPGVRATSYPSDMDTLLSCVSQGIPVSDTDLDYLADCMVRTVEKKSKQLKANIISSTSTNIPLSDTCSGSGSLGRKKEETRPTAPDTKSKQETFAEVLQKVNIALAEICVPYFLASGTALGAIRDGAFLAHDEDIDIGVFYRDLKENPRGALDIICALQSHAFVPFDILGEFEHGFEIRFQHSTGVLLDVNIFYHDDDHIWWATYYGEAEKRRFKKYRYKHTVFEPIEKSFAGAVYRVAPVSFLEEHYGKDWTTPKTFDYWQGLRGEYHNIIEE